MLKYLMYKRENCTLIIVIILLMVSCDWSKPKNNVVFDATFGGARLDRVISLENDRYKLKIKPAFEPVNKSPYYAFSVISKSPKTIELELDYGEYKHRYIPKLSYDRITWEKIGSKNINLDTLTGKPILKLDVSSKKLYVSAQEIESSEDTNSWVDELLIEQTEIEKIIAGKTVLGKNNYVLEIENDSIVNSIVLIARQHPPEIPGGTIGFKAFFEELLSNSKAANIFRSKFNVYTFPLLNPDGADMGNWRHNANGVDLNRDWVDFTQPETQMVDTYLNHKIKEGKKIRFALDFHTSYSGPYMLILDSLNEIKTNKIIPDWIQRIENNSQFKVEARRRSQDLPYCYNYFFNKFHCEAVTYEEGDEVDRDIIKKRAQAYARELMATLNDNN